MADLGEYFDPNSIPNFGPEFDALPDLPALAELKGYPQWVGWTWSRRQTADGWRWTKPPVNPTNGRSANVASQTSWASYERAAKAVDERELAGVGFVLTERDPYIGIDLDKCRDPVTGEINAWALDILALAETYAEISPSETGIRLIARGGIEKASKCDPAHVEIYDRGRYVTITGRHVAGSPTEIREAPDTLAALAARIATFRPEPVSPAKPTTPTMERSRGSGRDFFRAVNDLALANLVVNQLRRLPMAVGSDGSTLEPHFTPLDAGANDTLEAFGQRTINEARTANGGHASALGKARGHALRLSCILEHLWWAALPGRNAEPAAISARAMRAAIALMEDYFLPMAERVFGDAIVPVSDKDAVRLARWLCKERLTHFNAREVRNRLGGSLRKAEAMDAACDVLVDAGALRPVGRVTGAKGRAPKQFAVNSHLIE